MNIIEIKDINAEELDIFARLSEAQLLRYYEPDLGLFIAESVNVILRALEAGYEPLSILVEADHLEKEAKPVLDAVERLWGREKLDAIPVYTAPGEVVKLLTGYEFVRGLWMCLRRKKHIPIDDFCKEKNRIAVLYDVVNPTNVGTIVRSAAALGMDGVLLNHISADPFARRAARVSMGTVFQIPWTKGTKNDPEGADFIRRLQESGFKTVAMALTEDSTGIDNEEIRENEKLAVILGNEGYGLPKEVIETCDYRVMIPMYHGVDSLNVAAASAISFWELLKNRR
ncbi:MAG: RNA methyltransferase [Acetatifactor sp.]|nr:RNA methyltransferase [Acetatifactor sp.]